MMKRPLIGLILGILCISNDLGAQTLRVNPDSNLIGIKVVNPRISVTANADERYSLLSDEDIRTIMFDKFTLELRRLGVPIDSNALSVLYCEINIMNTPPDLAGGAIVYAHGVELYELVTTPSGDVTPARTWNRASVGWVGKRAFRDQLRDLATSCAEKFANPWFVMNPRR